MQGLELCRQYYERYGAPMLQEQFGAYCDRIAVGLVGDGSECWGYDDSLSQDHDFEPGFCMWLTFEDYRRIGFALERAYAKLPQQLDGYRRQPLSPEGGSRHGVMVIEDFYKRFLGVSTLPQPAEWWFFVPSHALANACNGQVFKDDLGMFSAVRHQLLAGYPLDVRKKKLAAHLMMMAQTGQYNYGRSLQRQDRGAAALSADLFVRHTIGAVYMLNNAYEPYYKWAFRRMRELPVLGEIEETLIGLLELGNGGKEAALKAEIIEDVAAMVLTEVRRLGWSNADCNNCNTHAYRVMDTIQDPSIRNMHVMDGI